MPSNRNMSRNMQRGRGGRRRAGATANRARVATSSFLPNYSVSPIQVRKYRFQANAAGAYQILRGDMLGLYAWTTSSTSFSSLIGGIRVLSCSVFSVGAPTTSLQFAEVALEWLSETGPSNQIVANGNADHPAVIKTAPPPGSLAGNWSSSGFTGDEGVTDPLFVVTVNSGDIVEIVVEQTPLVLGTGLTGSYTVGTTNAANFGYLDGAGGHLVVQGNVNIYH